MSFDTELLRRRGLALTAAGLLAVGGAAAAGCGDDNNKGVDDQIENAADDAGDKLDRPPTMPATRSTTPPTTSGRPPKTPRTTSTTR